MKNLSFNFYFSMCGGL